MIKGAKKFVFSAVCSPGVGRLIQLMVGNSLRSRGAQYDVSGWEPHLVAALALHLYERSEIDFAIKYLRNSPRVLELGGCRGGVSSALLVRLPPGSKLVSVEANPRLIPDLRVNLARNASGKNVTTLHFAVGDGDKLLFDTSRGTLGSSLSAVKGEKIPMISLSALLKRLAWTDYTLLSDIEGAEASFILGDSSPLQGCSRMVIEMHQTTYAGAEVGVGDLICGLEDAGFRMVDRHTNVGVFIR